MNYRLTAFFVFAAMLFFGCNSLGNSQPKENSSDKKTDTKRQNGNAKASQATRKALDKNATKESASKSKGKLVGSNSKQKKASKNKSKVGRISKTQHAFLKKLQRTYMKAGSIDADFTQEVFKAVLFQTKTNIGHITISKPNYLRWEIHKSQKSVMVSDGKQIWYYTPDAQGGKGQAIARPASLLTKNAIVGLLSGRIPILKSFRVLKFSSKSDHTLLALEPRVALNDIERVLLKVNKKTLIEDIQLNHFSGNRTKISLKNIAVGGKKPTVLFKFKPPKGTVVVKD